MCGVHDGLCIVLPAPLCRDVPCSSSTAYGPDNYSQEFEHPMQPGGWLRFISGHPCFVPGKVRWRRVSEGQ